MISFFMASKRVPGVHVPGVHVLGCRHKGLYLLHHFLPKYSC